MSGLMDNFWAAPPVARTLAAAVFVTSVGVRLLGVIPAGWLYLDPYHLVTPPPQIWRLATNFLVSGPQLGIVLDPYFLFSYLKQLETSNPKFSKKEDVVWYLMTVSTMILVLNYLSGTNAPFCLQGLILALAYTGTQDQRGQQASFFFLTIPAQLVPYAMLFATLVMAGPDQLFIQMCGLVAAHLHDFLFRIWPEFGGGRNILATPEFMSEAMQMIGLGERSYGAVYYGGGSGRTTGSSAGSGPLPDSWKTRGTGHRLG
ncbi:hypothetical protein MAPG_12122 [Magnaporthiopsis poae ATCC 64411]|uniref:Derlin n=1 Tax=Magnaporthiopsis poae (strain ATCC 64411 / 73-15) TaxID=644358 RepID=A0A0C4EGV9_MAGP6|nr:hypothetical protein MAPG_12122 [Magnaporthiopsis poae ATCC 64411]